MTYGEKARKGKKKKRYSPRMYPSAIDNEDDEGEETSEEKKR
jgi:hypothetical protein